MFKKFFALFFSLLALILILGILPVHGETQIYDNVLRLHVLANSDSEEDQALKLSVRDAVLEYSTKLLSDAKSKEEAQRIISASLPNLQAVAQQALRDNDCSYPVTISFSKENYPTRNYEACAFPAGEYMSLQIKLGNAEGKNWWCVLYPPLCLAAASDSSDAFLQAGIDSYQYNIITDSSNPKYKIRFKLLEAFNS